MRDNEHSDDRVNGNNNDPLRTRQQLCRQGAFGPKTLSRIEARGDGPERIEITPGLIRYRQSKIDEWLAARAKTGAKTPGRTPVQAIAARHRR